MTLRGRESYSSRIGKDWFSARYLFGWLGFYRRTTDQIWSPALTERQYELGIEIGHVRIGFSRTRKVWTDGRAPQSEKGFY